MSPEDYASAAVLARAEGIPLLVETVGVGEPPGVLVRCRLVPGATDRHRRRFAALFDQHWPYDLLHAAGLVVELGSTRTTPAGLVEFVVSWPPVPTLSAAGQR